MPGIEVTPEGDIKHFPLNAWNYSVARRQLEPGDQAWCRLIVEKLVDDLEGETVLLLADGGRFELKLP